MKKVLLINLKRKKCNSVTPHLGLGMLASVLKNSGHKVLVVDYQFYPTNLDIELFIKDFHPDVVGISLFTSTILEADNVITKLNKYNLPIIVGGPHTFLYWEELQNCKMIDYIVIGEAENIINDLINNAKKEKLPQIVRADLPDVNLLPFPDLTSFLGYKNISVYPLSMSRGCPFQCGFCMIPLISKRKWRAKNIETCIEELIIAKKVYPKLSMVVIYDDNPTVDVNRFKNFLRLYIKENIGLKLNVINIHAKSIDDEMIILLKKANVETVCMGVEHVLP